MEDAALPPDLDPEMREALLEDARRNPGGTGEPANLPIEEVRQRYAAGRAFWNADRPDLPEVADRRVPGPFGEIPVRLYYPANERPLPVLVFFHGGGFIYGSIDTHDKICRWLARRSGVAVCSVDYRLAPEFKFPTPLEEAEAVIDWLAQVGGDLGIDPEQLALGGDSAGASISLGTAVALKKAGRLGRLSGLVLFYGSYGLGAESESARLYGSGPYGLSEERRKFYRQAYVATAADAEDPRLKQLAADLSGLPPVFIGAAELDMLRDDSPALATKLQESGVPHTLSVYPGVTHGFLHMTRMVGQARRALDEAGDALKHMLSG